jgi:glutamate racemase
MDTRPIGVFDSGIGGLTVLKELEETFKEENFIYLGDTLNFPYGDKTKEEIISFSKSNIEYLISKNVKMIIIACGTATSQSLDEMRELFDIPIMGIIEPTVQYVKNMSIRKIGVIATTGTIRSGAWEKSLKKQISDIEVVSNACPLLAGIAEEGKATSKESIEAVHNYMEIFKQNHIDTIILGCTHYPIYDEIIKKEFSYKVNLINTGKAVAQNVKKYLSENKIQNKGVKNPPKIILSKKETDFDQKAKNILKSAKKLDITNFY